MGALAFYFNDYGIDIASWHVRLRARLRLFRAEHTHIRRRVGSIRRRELDVVCRQEQRSKRAFSPCGVAARLKSAVHRRGCGARIRPPPG